ncbi:MAG: asparagine synthase (glutamine-hydrolyzing) [bacterium]
MCGICGYIGNPVSEKIITLMTDTLVHRGPDAGDTYVNGNVHLGHRRLSIIDLSEIAVQPMCNEDSTVWTVFNGEIYNHLDIREELLKEGHVFKTSSDTEVLVHGYEKWGRELAPKLNGMFAFAVYDKNKRELFLARDRMGQKPLYYYNYNGLFAFASEIKALLKHPDIPAQLDPVSLQKYLAFEYVPVPRSIISNISKLPGSCCMIFSLQTGKFKINRYWECNYKAHVIPAEKDAIEFYKTGILQRLERSVKLRLMSDVPLGVFLSGGIDSSTITALMAKSVDPKNIKTFSIGFKEKSFDETSYARLAAKYFGTDHREEILEPKTMIDILPEITSRLDEPFADASIIPTYLLSKFTRRHVTVALGGDGGDELLCGYDPFLAYKAAEIYNYVPGIAHLLIKKLVSFLPVSSKNMSLDFRAKRFLMGIGHNHYIRNQVWLGAFDMQAQFDLLNEDFICVNKQADLYNEINELMYEDNGRQGEVTDLIYQYTRTYLQEDILTKVDRASMMNSLEVRAPMLDYNFVEFVNGIPWEYKLRGFDTKFIFKEAVKEILPKDIIRRSKKGFGIPVSRWLRNELREILLDTLSKDKIKSQGIFNENAVECLVQEHLEGKKDVRKELWTIFMFEKWRESFLK